MNKEDIIKACKYYKGEETCPFDVKTNYPAAFFWQSEMMLATKEEKFITPWVKIAVKRCNANKEMAELFKEQTTDLQKGIRLYCMNMVSKWAVYNPELCELY